MSELSPRQRMINMMYLVLTALLAMNISKEVLLAFQKIDTSIAHSYSDKLGFNDKHYDDFDYRAAQNPGKLGVWNDIAKDLKLNSKEIIELLDTVRAVMTRETGVDDDGQIINMDDKEITIDVLIKSKEEKGYGLGKKLKAARAKYKDYLLGLDTLNIYEGSDTIYKMNIQSLFTTEDWVPPDAKKTAAPMSWEYQFKKLPPVAALAFMNKMKLDVGNIEGTILELIQKKTGQSSITVNSQLGVVTAPKQSIMLGDSFHARVFIAGVDTNQLPKFNTYNYDTEGNRIEDIVKDTLLVDGSEGVFSVKPTKQGTYWLGGDILVQSEEGEKKYEFKQQYRVDEPMSVISPEKMNVIYTEVVNPLSISVPGYSSDELQLYSDFSGCKIKRIKNGSYEAIISKRQKKKETVMSLYVKHKGTGKLVGKKIKFRVKNVPPPKPSIRNKVGSQTLSVGSLSTAAGIRATLENFDFDIQYVITSYTYSYPTNTGAYKSQTYKGGRFKDIKSQFNSLKPGQKIYFENFEYKLKGSNSKPVELRETLVITIK